MAQLLTRADRPRRMSWESQSTFDDDDRNHSVRNVVRSEARDEAIGHRDQKHAHLENVYSSDLEHYAGHRDAPYDSSAFDPKLPEDSIPLRERERQRGSRHSLVAPPQRSRFTFVFARPYFVWVLSAVDGVADPDRAVVQCAYWADQLHAHQSGGAVSAVHAHDPEHYRLADAEFPVSERDDDDVWVFAV
ncbi:hypothetical protein NEOLI_000585 [Neolecta irregularis DAH-3]|uniref:Uncharacterized protein n=1 Tax=Neolecta irregularis (strain DAH-3) TaxID=1198029 RepID=A0A1U7LKV9_NEOID|nr:hypothetical protein NEOLI_000585 [Neolecta irregularis DAH-3]|eukprot:OLL23161.1 hypothetical protein NEOLI_000585 [Neolecta irregularis DAH-3]